MPELIAIEGCIGAGKTTLAQMLADDLDYEVAREQFEENPFLSRFYADREKYALPTEMYFLLQRCAQMEAIAEAEGQRFIADYSLYKSYVFTQTNLKDEELEQYNQLFGLLMKKIVQPKAMVYISRPMDALMANIARRGRDYEQKIPRAYLEGIERHYRRILEHLDIPLLFIDAGTADYKNNSAHYNQIRDALKEVMATQANIKISLV